MVDERTPKTFREVAAAIRWTCVAAGNELRHIWIERARSHKQTERVKSGETAVDFEEDLRASAFSLHTLIVNLHWKDVAIILMTVTDNTEAEIAEVIHSTPAGMHQRMKRLKSKLRKEYLIDLETGLHRLKQVGRATGK